MRVHPVPLSLSWMDISNRIGSSMAPWRTPVSTGFHSDLDLLIQTLQIQLKCPLSLVPVLHKGRVAIVTLVEKPGLSKALGGQKPHKLLGRPQEQEGREKLGEAPVPLPLAATALWEGLKPQMASEDKRRGNGGTRICWH